MTASKKIQHPGAERGTGDARAKDAGRRAYVRYPVVLDAVIVTAQGQTIPCAMRDFCMGGMLLNYKPGAIARPDTAVAAADLVSVQCHVPDAGADRLLEFPARVARGTQDGVGVAFVDPDVEALRLMQRFAVNFSAQSASERAEKYAQIRRGENKVGGLGRRYNDIVTGCSQIVRETMQSLLEQINEHLAERLFDLSREAVVPEEQADYFSASETLRTNKERFLDGIRGSFEEHLNERVANSLGHARPQAGPRAELSLEDMSLIGDEDLGAWLAVSEITNKVEEKNKEALNTLEQRLSVIFATTINHVNNPYGPALFAESFQSALGAFKFKEAANVACYAILKEALIPALSGLYGKLNDILIGYDILPKLKYTVVGHSVPLRRHGAASTPAEPSGSTPPGGAYVQHMDAAAAAAPGVDRSSATTSEAPPARTVSRPDVMHEVPSDLYQLIENLRGLRREFSGKRSYGLSDQMSEEAGARGNDREGRVPDNWYSTSELINLVADLQAAPGTSEPRDSQPVSVKSRILAALGDRSLNEGGKGINPRDDNVLEVAGDILSAVQEDPLVAGGVKPWLKRLELPVLKLALQDPSLFFDQAHVVRQVVNSIAQLEFYQQDESGAGKTSIGAAIEGLLEKVASERSDGMEIFTEIQSKLNKLVGIQNLAYAENLKDVVKACEEAAPIPEDYGFDAVAGDNVGDAEMHKWMMFAQRLREGDEVLFTTLDGKPQRLRVAWIDGRRSIYVFVNLRGIKEKVMRVGDVARMIRLGVIQPQGNAADPAMDRAQYSIMQNLYKQVVYESTHDGMTGLVNRREFSRRLDRVLIGTKRCDQRHVLALVDIDQFSAINSSCGYGGGDKLLRDVVDILRSGLEGKGEMARVGSDQFAILLEECPLDDALEMAERRIEDVANYRLAWDDHQYSISISVGVVPISARSGSVDELMQAAESSCKTAKDAGGNRLQVFHAGYSRLDFQGEIKKWAAKIDKILEEGGLEIRCQRIQPIGDETQLLPHYEILLGVRDEHGDIVSPVEFIKGAELSRKMSAVDRYVISAALEWMNANADTIASFAGFTINLSGESLNEEGFIDFVLEQLKDIRVPYEKICFEVTETVGITNLSGAALMIERIKDTGCRFALDDFGSGMSSYGYLKNLPVDVVKIDGAFVKDLAADSSDYAVVKSITEIAHFMKKKVVAEFVESDETLNLLREIGVDYVQGFMIDKPGPLDRLVHIASGRGA